MSEKKTEQENEEIEPSDAKTLPETESDSGSEGSDDMEKSTAADTPKSLEEQLEEAIAEVEKNKDSWIRATAELENVRKRAQADIAGVKNFAGVNIDNSGHGCGSGKVLLRAV